MASVKCADIKMLKELQAVTYNVPFFPVDTDKNVEVLSYLENTYWNMLSDQSICVVSARLMNSDTNLEYVSDAKIQFLGKSTSQTTNLSTFKLKIDTTVAFV